jgi:hypothetical protein
MCSATCSRSLRSECLNLYRSRFLVRRPRSAVPLTNCSADFDDEEYASTPVPFGRSGLGGGTVVGSGSGQESPVMSTSLDRYERAPNHSRSDSIASEDSFNSSRYTSGKPTVSLLHGSQSIAASNSSPFTKKPSLASIRNAFKHGEARFTRGRSKTHTYGRSQHSISGSTFHSSDTGSDQGHGFTFSPPPVPKVPSGYFGQMPRSETPPAMADYEDKIVMDPRTPSDYALHAVFIRFATAAENKIDSFLRQGLVSTEIPHSRYSDLLIFEDCEPPLPDIMGPEVDPKFDEVLQSFGKIALKHAKPVIDTILRWRRSQNESVSHDFVRLHHPQSSHEAAPILTERKSLASVYVTCRVLIAVLQSISKDALGEALGYTLEETTFEQFRKPHLKLLAHSVNHRSNAELVASLLGHIANIR